jgi:hypothetical protein
MPLDLPPYIQRPDDLGEQRQAAARRDLFLRVFNLESQDALRYHALALLVKVFTHRVKLVFSTITLYQKGLSCQPPILSAIYGLDHLLDDQPEETVFPPEAALVLGLEPVSLLRISRTIDSCHAGRIASGNGPTSSMKPHL